MVAYKKLVGVHLGTANIAKLILPAGATIFAGELFRFIGILPDGRADEECVYSGSLGPYHRRIYEGLNPDIRDKRMNWQWFIRHTDSRKMRASEAYVESIFRVDLNRTLLHFEDDGEIVTETSVVEQLTQGTSGHDWNFRYEPGKTVRPKNGFCTSDEQCSDGIHFFFNLVDALAYEL